jgi:hypothetical protein
MDPAAGRGRRHAQCAVRRVDPAQTVEFVRVGKLLHVYSSGINGRGVGEFDGRKGFYETVDPNGARAPSSCSTRTGCCTARCAEPGSTNGISWARRFRNRRREMESVQRERRFRAPLIPEPMDCGSHLRDSLHVV